MNAVNDTADEHSYRKLLTNYAFKKWLSEKKCVDHVVFIGESDGKQIYKSHADARPLFSIDVDGKTCSCPFFKMMSLPCRHLVYFLREKQADLYVPKLCNQRWYKSYLPSELLGDISYIQKKTVMSQAEKFRNANGLLTRLAEVLSEKPHALFQTYISTLQNIGQLVEEDKLFAINEIAAGKFD